MASRSSQTVTVGAGRLGAALSSRLHYITDTPADSAGGLVTECAVNADSVPLLRELDDVFLIPEAKGLYTKDGERITDSCVCRGRFPNIEVLAGPSEVYPPRDYETVSAPVVYLSWLQNHWGHFLTEGISRLWAFNQYPELESVPGLYCALQRPHSSIREFIKLLNYNVYFAGCKRRDPVLLRKVFLPLPSFVNQKCCYSVHTRIPEQVVRKALSSTLPSPTSQPAVLSRHSFRGSRSILRQAEFEALLLEKSAVICHPENMTLAEQIQLFNKHKHFIGCWGSAFHGCLLARPEHSISTHMLCNGTPGLNYVMMDSICTLEANYLDMLFPSSGLGQQWPYLHLDIDLEAVRHYIEACVALQVF